MQHSTRRARSRSATSKDRVSFATLPGYDELRLFRSIGEKFGLDNPYFRLHEARAGIADADRRKIDPQFLLL